MLKITVIVTKKKRIKKQNFGNIDNNQNFVTTNKVMYANNNWCNLQPILSSVFFHLCKNTPKTKTQDGPNINIPKERELKMLDALKGYTDT